MSCGLIIGVHYTPPTSTPWSTLENIAKAVAVIGSVLYILGLLVVNVYLGQWYVMDYSLLSARFIASGVLFVLSTIGITLIPMIATFILYEGVQKGLENYIITRLNNFPRVRTMLKFTPAILGIGAFIYGAYLIYGLIVVLVEHNRQFRVPFATDQSAAFEAILIYSAAFLTSGCILHAFIDPWGKPMRALGRVSIYVCILMFYLGLFARGVYGGLPFDVGGGSPRPRQLLFAADKLTSVTQLGIPLEANQNLSKPVLVLFEGTDTYLLRLENGSVVQITKDLIEGGRVREATPAGTP